MKNHILFIFILLPLSVFSQEEKFRNFYTQPGGEKGKGIALVLANNKYEYGSSLELAVDDGKIMSAALKAVGFDIELGYNLSKDEMLNAITEFSNKLSGYEQAVIFYAGHAAQVGDNNYLMPSDTKVDNELIFKGTTLNVKDVFQAIDNSNIPKVIILDACRNNPMMRKMKSSSSTRAVQGGGLKEVDASKNSMVIFSTTANTVVSDNNPFTEIFSNNIKAGGCIENVLKKTRNDILAKDRQQLIWSREALTGSICFGDNPNPNPVNIDDMDNDGLADKYDNCPKEKGPVSNYGCPLNTKIYKKDRFLFGRDNLVGYTDIKGNSTIPAKFDLAWPFHENRARVLKGAAWHYINKSGKVITKTPYDSITTFKNGTGIFKLNNLFGVVDSLGNELNSAKFSSLKHSAGSRNLIYSKRVNGKEKWGLLDNQGNLVIQPIYETDFEFSEGIASSIRNGRMVFFNTKAEVLFSGNYERADLFKRGTVFVELANRTYQILDRTGSVIQNSVSKKKRKFKEFPTPYKSKLQLKTEYIFDEALIDGVSYELVNENKDIVIKGRSNNIIYDGELLYVLGQENSTNGSTLKVYNNEGSLLKSFNNVASYTTGYTSQAQEFRYYDSRIYDNRPKADFSLRFWGKINKNSDWKYYYLFNDLSEKFSSAEVEVKSNYPIPKFRKHFVVHKPSSGNYGILDYKGRIIIPTEFSDISFPDREQFRYGNYPNFPEEWLKIENSYVAVVTYKRKRIYINGEGLWHKMDIMSRKAEEKISQLGLTQSE